MKKFCKRLSVLLAAVLVAGMIAGCGGSSTAETTVAPAETEAPAGGEETEAPAGGEETEAPAETEAPEAEPSGGAANADAIIKVGVSGTPQLDPAVMTTASEVISFANLYDQLVIPNVGDTGIQPHLAESWEVSDDGMTYTFHLKQGVKFHNGEELKASDVVYSADRFMTIGEGFSYCLAGVLEPGNTTAVDDYTVEMKLSKPFGPFLEALVRLGIVSEKEVTEHTDFSVDTYGENGDYGKAWMVEHDAGSGAYQAVEVVQQDYMYAEKFNDWWKGFTYDKCPEGFKLMCVTEAATVKTMVMNKELDITDQWQAAETLKALDELDGVDIAGISNMLEQNIYINSTCQPLEDINIRRALNCLVDYDTIMGSIFLDSKQACGPTPSYVKGHVDTTQYHLNIEEAQKYVDASTYAANIGDYPIELTANSDVPDQEKVALIIKSEAEKVGIVIEVVKSPWVAIQDQMATPESSPMMIFMNSAPPYDDAAVYLQSRYSKSTQGTWENGEWLDDAKLEDGIAACLSETDEAKRAQMEADLQNYIVDELCPSVWLADLTERHAYHSDYIKWHFAEDVPEGTVASTTNGWSQVYANMEYFPENK